MRINKKRIKAARKLKYFKELHGTYCKWTAVKWVDNSYREIDKLYVHFNCTKYIIKQRKKL